MLILIFTLLFGVCAGQRQCDNPIQRPCPDFNPNCIRNFFAQVTGCQAEYGDGKQLHYIDYLQIPLPYANVTFTWVGAEVKGLGNWKITELYINRNTKNIVMEVSLNDVVTYGDNTRIKYYLKAREPLTLTGYFSFTYIKMFITATIPFDPAKGILWSGLDCFAYHAVRQTPYMSSSSLVNSDPEVRASYYELLHNPELALKDGMPVVPPYYFKLFFNNYLCKL